MLLLAALILIALGIIGALVLARVSRYVPTTRPDDEL